MSLPAAVTQETRAIRPCRKFEGHTRQVSGVIHLPGEQRIMTCSYDGSLRVWDLQNGKQIGNDWRDGESDVNTIALSQDGKKLASGSDDGAVRLWDIDAGKVIAKWTGHTRYVVSVCWSEDGEQVVSGSYDGTAKVWDVESGKTILAIETGFRNVRAVIYSPDTTMIVTGGDNEEEEDRENLKIWDAKTGKLVANLKGHINHVNCIAWTADGKTLISGSSDSSIRMWNTTPWQQIAILTGHTDSVFGIPISPNGRILASASLDKTVQLWNLENNQPIGSLLQHADALDCVSFSTDGKLLATGCRDNNAYTWDISAIIKEAGFGDLLKPNDKSEPNATRRRGDWRRNPYPGPSNNTLHHPHLSAGQIISPPSARQQHVSAHISSHQRTPPGRISSPSRGNNDNASSSPTPLSFLGWARHPFFNTRNRQDDESIELPERRTEVVDVPFGQARPRYYTAREVKIDKEKARNVREAEKQKAREAKHAKNTKNVPASSSRPSQSNVTQQLGKEAQTAPAPQQHSIGVPTSSTTSVIAANSTGTPHWTRFLSAACCRSTQNAHGND